MKVSRNVFTFLMPPKVKPHQVNRAHEGRYPSFSVGGMLRTTKELQGSFKEEQTKHFEENDVISISLNVCFDKKSPNPYMTVDAAKKKFQELTGLGSRSSSSFRPLPKDHIKDKVSLINVFCITGNFQVKDLEKFAKAFEQGVGSRFSYGYGLLEVHD